MSNISKEQIQERIIKVLKNYIEPEVFESQEVTGDTTLDEIGLDSFKAIYLLLDLEDEFGVTIPDTMLSPEIFYSVGNMTKTVKGILDEQ